MPMIVLYEGKLYTGCVQGVSHFGLWRGIPLGFHEIELLFLQSCCTAISMRVVSCYLFGGDFRETVLRASDKIFIALLCRSYFYQMESFPAIATSSWHVYSCRQNPRNGDESYDRFSG